MELSRRLRQLKRAKVSTNDMVYFYCTCIRSVVEYASPVFHYALPGYLSDDLERIQNGSFLGPSWDHLFGTILGPGVPYSDGLVICKLSSLANRRQVFREKLFKSIVNDPSHKLYKLFPAFNVIPRYSLRNKRLFIEPRYHTNRFRISFFPASVHHCNF